MVGDSGLYKDLLKTKSLEEVQFWKRKSEQLQKELHEAEVTQGKLISDVFQVYTYVLQHWVKGIHR